MIIVSKHSLTAWAKRVQKSARQWYSSCWESLWELTKVAILRISGGGVGEIRGMRGLGSGQGTVVKDSGFFLTIQPISIFCCNHRWLGVDASLSQFHCFICLVLDQGLDVSTGPYERCSVGAQERRWTTHNYLVCCIRTSHDSCGLFFETRVHLPPKLASSAAFFLLSFQDDFWVKLASNIPYLFSVCEFSSAKW